MNNMKKLIIFGMLLVMAITLVACGGGIASKIKDVIGAENWDDLSKDEQSELVKVLNKSKGDEELAAKEVYNTLIVKDQNLIGNITSAIQVTIANKQSKGWYLIPFEIIITRDGCSLNIDSDYDDLVNTFLDMSGYKDLKDIKTSLKNHKIVLSINEKGAVKSELIDTETGEAPEYME